MEDQLCGTLVTGNTLQDLLAQSPQFQLGCHRFSKVEAKIIGEKSGFTSRILRVFLDWDKPSKLPNSVIVKVVGSGSGIKDTWGDQMEQEKIHTSLCAAHNVECKVYQLDSMREAVPMPLFYGAIPSVDGKPGILLLEDLCDIATSISITDIGDGLTMALIDHVIDALTSLHAWSVNDTKWRQFVPSLAEHNPLAGYHDQLVTAFPQTKAAYPEEFKRVDEQKFKEYFSNEKYEQVFAADPKKRYNLPLVLAHGDFQSMNMLFKNGSSDMKTPEKVDGVVLIDWQLSHQGCGMEDLARIMFFSFTTDIRRNESDHIVQKYVQLFNSKVKADENRVSLADCKRALEEMFSYLAVIWTNGMAQLFSWDDTRLDVAAQEEKKATQDRMMNSYFASLHDALAFFGW